MLGLRQPKNLIGGKMPLTEEEKIALYRAGRYCFPAPPVYTGNWDEAAWIRFIDKEGRWLQGEKDATTLG